MVADQSAYIEPTEDKVKIVQAKELMKRALFVIDPWGHGAAVYEDMRRYIDNA